MVHFLYGTIHYVIHFPLSIPCVIPSHVVPALGHMICFSPCEKQPLWLKLLLLFNHSVVSEVMQPHGPQQARLPCTSQSPRVCSNSCPLSRWCHPTILSSGIPFSSCPQSFSASGGMMIFQWVSSLYQVAIGLELQLQYSPSSEYSGLISFRIDWFDLLAVQETLKSLLQDHSSKASVLQCSAFFMVPLSYP